MKRPLRLAFALTAFASMSSAAPSPARVTTADFGRMPDGRPVHLYTLTNAHGVRADITDYGAIIVRLFTPDRTGQLDDVVLGFDDFESYVKQDSYFGAVVGRYGNRIADGKFTLDGTTHTLAKNNTPNGIPCHLHGGKLGFDKVLWTAEPLAENDAAGLKLTYVSRDGEEGYPGNLTVTVHYRLTDADELAIRYEATTDRATPINVTQHTYFNLRGAGVDTILDHVVSLDASHFTPTGPGLIPTGEIAPVANTPFDFASPHAIGERIAADHEQIRFGGGYDHNWVLDHRPGEFARAAVVWDPVTGRVMEVSTDQPGIQFYTGNFLDGTITGKNGRRYVYRSGLCLETQHFPDSPNQSDFPSTILRPGETFTSRTTYRFRAR